MATKPIVSFVPPLEDEANASATEEAETVQPEENGEAEIIDNDEVRAVAGEVIVPIEQLKINERIIKRGWKIASDKMQQVYNALTIIHTRNLWKLHVEADGKRKYTSFEKYLFVEFGWDLDRTRALQIIKATRPKLLESGELSADEMPNERTRTAPEVTATKAAKVTITQLTNIINAFRERMGNIEYGPGREALDAIYDDLVAVTESLLNRLQQVVDDEEQLAAKEKEERDTAAINKASGPSETVSPLRARSDEPVH